MRRGVAAFAVAAVAALAIVALGSSTPHPAGVVVAGKPGLWYLTGGRVVVTRDEDGDVTSVDVAGTLVDLCTRLAP